MRRAQGSSSATDCGWQTKILSRLAVFCSGDRAEGAGDLHAIEQARQLQSPEPAEIPAILATDAAKVFIGERAGPLDERHHHFAACRPAP